MLKDDQIKGIYILHGREIYTSQGIRIYISRGIGIYTSEVEGYISLC